MTTTNWAILNEPGVMDACEKAATKVAARYRGVIEGADLLQEAYIVVATKSVYGKFIEDGSPGAFYFALWADLMDIADKQSTYHRNTVPLEREYRAS